MSLKFAADSKQNITNQEVYQRIKQKKMLTQFLSQNQSQHQLSSKLSCYSGRSYLRPKPFERTKKSQVIIKRNKEEVQSPKLSYISPERYLKSDDQKSNLNRKINNDKQNNNKIKLNGEYFPEKHRFEQQKDNKCKSNAVDSQEFSSKKNEQLLKKISNANKQNRMLATIIKQEKVQNSKLKFQIAKSIQNQENLKIEIQSIKQQYNKIQQRLEDQKQINTCLQYIIEGLNKQIQQFLLQQNTKCHSPIHQQTQKCAESQLDLSEFNHQQKEKMLNDIQWLRDMNKKIEQENIFLKGKIMEIRKDLKHYQFEASLTKKLRDELLLQKSLRQTYENKNKLLNEKLKSLNKKIDGQKKAISHSKILLEDSLSFSIDFQ